MRNAGFLKALILLEVLEEVEVQDNKPVTGAMNTLNECKKATSISTFDLYTKFPHKNF